MEKKDITTEQTILEAAEQEFLEKGFAGAKTTAIAKRAGVNHAMIHYYFRTKENLFTMVFQQKIRILAESFSQSFNQDLSFFDQLKLAIGTHFDFIAANPRLLFFVYGEIITNDRRKKMLVQSVFPKLKGIVKRLKDGIDAEVENGTIRFIRPTELLMNIIALNAITFLAMPLLQIIKRNNNEVEKLLKQRRENNIQFIINGLKI
ncbi:TetR/AcrR family transcriptional regulator [Dysgonomonas sp. HDW5A]|uniref:TetR/AcrR family transcriptional regulator n=1 Tax=unclassified Dysgonomonas TaxID=2630389 RepID=UPI001407C858|nr:MULTISPECIES: TetR/AcrR family transcriptional regulator [unclassified Dysgonomonas]QIK54489.1 TetR/AcrR family transcriptional regulator [Dysgonomonas sp. HDW5B]QIK59914.1 TetR/AcrR family transcriptional regulator [Dysgonomonas sp. HDW5A]